MSRILITIPTWNEARVIQRTLEVVSRYAADQLAAHDVLIEVADNGSTDGTADVVRRILSSRPERSEAEVSSKKSPGTLEMTLLTIPEKGKGIAIRRSWESHVQDRDILLFTDADLAADLSVLPEMIRRIESGETDIVCGSRFTSGATVERRASRELASRLFRVLQRIILDLPVEDAQCGLKAISAKAAMPLLAECREKGWLFDSELLYLARLRGFSVIEVPVTWVEHRDPNRRSALNILRDGWGFLLGLAQIRFR